MTTNNWKRELNRLLEIFEIKSTISLGKIKHYFEAMGRPYDEKFRQYFLEKSTERLNTSFDTVLFSGYTEASIQTTSNSIPTRQLASTSKHLNQSKVEPNTSPEISNVADNFNGEHLPTDTDVDIDHFIGAFVKREFNIKTETDCDADNVTGNSGENVEQSKDLESFEHLWDDLLSHIESKQNEAKRLKCNECDYMAKYNSHLSRHRKIHIVQREREIVQGPNNGLYKCDDCDMIFLKWNSLKCHLTVSHRNNQPSFNCVHCLRRFAQEAKKDRHESRCQSRRYECHLCKVYATAFKSHLEEHMRTHSGTKPNQCHLCNKCFRQKNNLKRHVDTVHKHANKRHK